MPAQLPDRIFYGKELHDLCTLPLELYWTKTGKSRPRFVLQPECRRGYVATWEIRDNQLYLREIKGNVRRRFVLWGRKVIAYSLRRLFGKGEERVKAVWFSGRLRIPAGNMTRFEDNAFDSRYERETIITVVKGDLNKIVTLDNANQKLTVER